MPSSSAFGQFASGMVSFMVRSMFAQQATLTVLRRTAVRPATCTTRYDRYGERKTRNPSGYRELTTRLIRSTSGHGLQRRSHPGCPDDHLSGVPVSAHAAPGSCHSFSGRRCSCYAQKASATSRVAFWYEQDNRRIKIFRFQETYQCFVLRIPPDSPVALADVRTGSYAGLKMRTSCRLFHKSGG